MNSLSKLRGLGLFFVSLATSGDLNESCDLPLPELFEPNFCPPDGVWPQTPLKEYAEVNCTAFEKREMYEKLQQCKVKRYCSTYGWGAEKFIAELSDDVTLSVLRTGGLEEGRRNQRKSVCGRGALGRSRRRKSEKGPGVCHITLYRYPAEGMVIKEWEKWVSGLEGECVAEQTFSEYVDLLQITASRLGPTPESCLELEVNNAECRDHGLLKVGLYADSVCKNQVVIYLPWVHLSTLLIILITVSIFTSILSMMGFPFETSDWFKETNPMPVVVSVSKEKEGEPVCCVCCDRPPDHMFIKCGHLGFCKECCQQLVGKCPFCSTPGPCSKVFHVASKPE